MFVQVFDLRTDSFDQIRSLEEQWETATQGQRTATRRLIGRDRNDSSHHCVIVEFPSYEEAMRNSELPATGEFARRIRELCDDGPNFVDLDVVDERRL